MFTTRRTVEEGVRMCTDFAAPSSIGPTVMPCPPVIFSTLKRILAESRVGQISRLASPVSVESIRLPARTASDNAESPCNSPSHSTSGAILANKSRASRILRAEARSEVPNSAPGFTTARAVNAGQSNANDARYAVERLAREIREIKHVNKATGYGISAMTGSKLVFTRPDDVVVTIDLNSSNLTLGYSSPATVSTLATQATLNLPRVEGTVILTFDVSGSMAADDEARDPLRPVERLRAIKRCMDLNKERIKDFSPAQVMAYAATMLMPGAMKVLMDRTGGNAFGSVVVSHVPGPREDLYWQGARLTGLYPASLLFDTLALNITVISRHDFVDFGLIACRKSVPHVQRVLDYLEDELAALEAAAGVGVPARKPAKSTKAVRNKRKGASA